MAASILSLTCPLCKERIWAGERRRVIAHDQREQGQAPICVYAHAGCYSGCVIIWPGQTLDQAIALSQQSSRDNALLAVGV